MVGLALRLLRPVVVPLIVEALAERDRTLREIYVDRDTGAWGVPEGMVRDSFGRVYRNQN